MNQVDPLQFISSSIGCFALSFLARRDLLQKIVNRQLEESSLKVYEDRIAIRSAIHTLMQSKVIHREIRPYTLTPLGKSVVDHISLIQMLLGGYGNLMVRSIVEKPTRFPIHDTEVAKASVPFGKNSIDPIVLEELSFLCPNKIICDLGCGIPNRLIEFCTRFGTKGLGLDCSKKTLNIGKKLIKRHLNITLEREDITNLQKIWPSVDILMQYFVLHDITPASKCISVLNGYRHHFPNFRYFVYIDIVFSPDDSDHMPGFDYVHGLQNIQTRTYEETIDLFNKASLTIYKERRIDTLPNTYLWILSDVSKDTFPHLTQPDSRIRQQ